MGTVCCGLAGGGAGVSGGGVRWLGSARVRSSPPITIMSGRWNLGSAKPKKQLRGYDNPTLTVDGVYNGGAADANRPRKSRLSFSTLTQEALPRIDSYSNTNDFFRKRPSISDFHNEPRLPSADVEADKKAPSNDIHGHGVKLGWIQGVFIPCLLNIWGVMLFLRLSWVVGEAGIVFSIVIIVISYIVCVITTLSLSAISTNGEVKGGGIYYIISRSLGPEFGASVGIILAFANAVAASLNTIGFCDSLNDLLREHNLKIVDGGVNDTRIVGVAAIFIMILICAVGMEWESKAQNVLIVVIVAAIANFLVGAVMGPQAVVERAKGFEGMSGEVFKANWNPRPGFTAVDFFSVFAIFFPSVTGIQAGANISGDLKDPAKAIPKGTLLALVITMISYVLFVLFAGSSSLRYASGSVSDFNLGNFTACGANCEYGLAKDFTIMQLMSGWSLLIYFGCWAATLSTALTNLLSVPRLIQALGIDHVYPGLIFFSKGYGKAGEPYRGYVLTFLISAAFLIIANLDLIAPLISNFYLASYALINFCTFHAALIRPLGWRPTFKYYNIWLSLLGALMCVVIMFLINWITSLITLVIFFILYIVVVYRNPDANWGSSTQAQTYKTALMTVQKLMGSSEHVKNYQPQLLVLSGQPQNRPALVDLANLITKNNSLLVCAEICQDRLYYRAKVERVKKGYDWLNLKKVKGFFNVVQGMDMESAAISMMQVSGVGKLKPNVLLMGFKSDWQKCTHEELNAYFNIMYEAFANRLAVAILRMPDGLDCSSPEPEDKKELTDLANQQVIMYDLGNSYPDLSGNNRTDQLEPVVLATTSLTIAGSKEQLSERPTIIKMKSIDEPKDILSAKNRNEANKILHKFPDGQVLEKSVLEKLTFFEKKHQKGRVDVWWLYDDGGLTILLPYILSTRPAFAHCEMRVFALANKYQDLKTEEENMSCLLHKFRIQYSSLTMINDIMEEPHQKTEKLFDELIADFTTEWAKDSHVSKDELAVLKEKTDRQLRLRELLLRHSKDSTFVVMSLPMPRKTQVPPPVYMAWLEVLTKDMPPFLLIRGNQAPVLTFYS